VTPSTTENIISRSSFTACLVISHVGPTILVIVTGNPPTTPTCGCDLKMVRIFYFLQCHRIRWHILTQPPPPTGLCLRIRWHILTQPPPPPSETGGIPLYFNYKLLQIPGFFQSCLTLEVWQNIYRVSSFVLKILNDGSLVQ